VPLPLVRQEQPELVPRKQGSPVRLELLGLLRVQHQVRRPERRVHSLRPQRLQGRHRVAFWLPVGQLWMSPT